MSRNGREFGSKIGSAGVASESQAARQRKERLRQLALETMDLSKDPYMRKNYQGRIDCTLCSLPLNDEADYLAHTQGKRHQTNLARRAAVQARKGVVSDTFLKKPSVVVRKPTMAKIGRPGFRVTKQRDPESGGDALLFCVQCPDILANTQPRHRFMSAFEQKVVNVDGEVDWQLILFAAEPYETIAFQIPNRPFVRDVNSDKFFSHWDADTKSFYLQIVFLPVS